MIRFFADHPTGANLLMVGFLVVGLAFLVAAAARRRALIPG